MAAELAGVLFEQGRIDEAERYVTLAREGARQDDASGQAVSRMAEARLLVRKGEVEEAVQLAHQAVETMGETEELLSQPGILLHQAEVLQFAGRAEDASNAVHKAIDFADTKGATVEARRAREFLAILAG